MKNNRIFFPVLMLLMDNTVLGQGYHVRFAVISNNNTCAANPTNSPKDSCRAYTSGYPSELCGNNNLLCFREIVPFPANVFSRLTEVSTSGLPEGVYLFTIVYTG